MAVISLLVDGPVSSALAGMALNILQAGLNGLQHTPDSPGRLLWCVFCLWLLQVSSGSQAAFFLVLDPGAFGGTSLSTIGCQKRAQLSSGKDSSW